MWRLRGEQDGERRVDGGRAGFRGDHGDVPDGGGEQVDVLRCLQHAESIIPVELC